MRVRGAADLAEAGMFAGLNMKLLLNLKWREGYLLFREEEMKV